MKGILDKALRLARPFASQLMAQKFEMAQCQSTFCEQMSSKVMAVSTAV